MCILIVNVFDLKKSESKTYSFLVTGMSDLSCDRQVILNDYLDEGALDELYVYSGAAGRIANKYTYEDGVHVEIPEDERSINAFCVIFSKILELKL